MAVGISIALIFLTVVPPILDHYFPSLPRAISKGNLPGIRRAISKGANINATDRRSGHTMLTLATQYARYNKKLVLESPELRQQTICKMLQILIDNGANVNAPDRFGRTALFLVTHSPYFRHPPSEATVKAHKELVAMLIAEGADVNTKCGDDGTPLHNAVRASSRNLPVVELLIKSGADVNAKNKKGETPLKLALRAKKEKISELLRKHGATE
jgi:ankyrin repeat protein